MTSLPAPASMAQKLQRVGRASVRFRVELGLLPLVAMCVSAGPVLPDDRVGDDVVIHGLVCEVPIETHLILDTEKEAVALCPAPVPNASVRLTKAGQIATASSSSGQSFETTADQRGRFVLRGKRFMDSSLRVESEGFLSWSEDTGIWLLEELARRPASAVVFAGLERPDDYTDLISADPASLLVPSPSISAPEQAWSKGGEALRIFLQSSYDVFAATDLDGKAWTRKKLAGKVVLIEFWASWCAPCVAELPYLRETYEQLKTRGFAIIGVNRDQRPPEQLKLWLSTHGVTWPQIADGLEVQGPMAKAFGVVGIPKSVLIDRQGRVVGVNLRGRRVTSKVAELLGEPRPVSEH